MQESKVVVFVVGPSGGLVQLRQLAERFGAVEYIVTIGRRDMWFVWSSVLSAFEGLARSCDCVVLFPGFDCCLFS